MKKVLISIQPKWCKLIANRQKTIEVRKTAPKETPFKCYIYETKFVNHCRGCEFYLFDCSGLGKAFDVCTYGDKPRITTLASRCWQDKYSGGKVIGEFVCDYVYTITNNGSFTINNDTALTNQIARESCLDYGDIKNYLGTKNGYALHITALKIYDKPKELSEFRTVKHIRGYQKKDYSTMIDRLMHSTRVEVTYITRPPQSWQYVEVDE